MSSCSPFLPFSLSPLLSLCLSLAHATAADPWSTYRGNPQRTLPGDLIHIEGCPTVVDGKVYFGAGNAGVLCVDMNRVTLDGKERSIKEIQEILDKKWKELLAKYEEDKKTDPVLARKPNED